VGKRRQLSSDSHRPLRRRRLPDEFGVSRDRLAPSAGSLAREAHLLLPGIADFKPIVGGARTKSSIAAWLWRSLYPPASPRCRWDLLTAGQQGNIVQLYDCLKQPHMEITVDTSAIMAVILNEPSKPRLLEQTRGATLISAPTLPWEVGNSLTALFRRMRVDLDQARAALVSFRKIPVRLVEIDLVTCVEMAKEHGMYAYDAYMLECARKSRTPLLSLDDFQRQIAVRLGIRVLEV